MTATTIVMLDNATLTASGASGSFPVPSITMAAIAVTVPTPTGTGTPTLTLWLQWSPDNGVTWKDFGYDQQLATSASATDQTAVLDKRNIVATTIATNMTVKYRHLPVTLIRINYIVSGTTPSFAGVTVILQGK